MGFPGGSDRKEYLRCSRLRFNLWVRKTPWRRKWQPTPVFLPGKSHEQESLAGYSPRDHKGVGHNLEANNNKSHPILIALILLRVRWVTTPTLTLVLECHHLALATPGFSCSYYIQVFQLVGFSSLHKVQPTEESDHGALQGCWDSSYKFLSQSTDERYVFWTLPVGVSGY